MKKNTILYIIITILLIIIAVGITYIIMNNQNNEEITEPSNNDNNQEENNNNEEPTLEDNITLKNTTMNNDTIIEEYEIILNGKKSNININYTYDECRENLICISGNYNNYEFYYDEIWKNDSDNSFTIQAIDQSFNENNFEIIRGDDNKNYLLIFANSPYTALLYVFNDQLNIVNDGIESPNWYEGDNGDGFVLYSFVNMPILENKQDIWYDDVYGIGEDNIYIKVENNKIYYLTPNISYYDAYINNNNENYEIKLEERVYTINNNKFTYEVINTYNIKEVVNGI